MCLVARSYLVEMISLNKMNCVQIYRKMILFVDVWYYLTKKNKAWKKCDILYMVILMDCAYLFEFVDDLIEEIDLTRMKMFLIRNYKS